MDAAFELGLYTFGDLMPEAQAGKAVGAQQRLAEILAAAKLADASGLDVFAVGEHHRLDMVISATPVVLAAIAAVTDKMIDSTLLVGPEGRVRERLAELVSPGIGWAIVFINPVGEDRASAMKRALRALKM